MTDKPETLESVIAKLRDDAHQYQCEFYTITTSEGDNVAPDERERNAEMLEDVAFELAPIAARLRELVKKWRRWTIHYKGTISFDRLDTFEGCADELEAILGKK